MKSKKIMSLLMAAAFIIPIFNFNNVNVKAQVSGQPSTPVAIGQPYQTIVNGQNVTAQDYEVTVPFIDPDITTNNYEKGYKDASEVLNKVPSTVTSAVNGQNVTFTKTNDVKFVEDSVHSGQPFPHTVTNTMTISCGIEDYALYQYAHGKYSISKSDLTNNFPITISKGLVDTNPSSSNTFNGNYALVWRGDYDNSHIPILAAEAYQGFYPSLTGGSISPLKRRPYDVVEDFSIEKTNMTTNLTEITQPVFIDVPQGQSFDSTKSYEFDAITSNLLAFTYSATDGTHTYTNTSYTTLSNPMTSSDLKFFYPDYYDSSQYTTRKIIDVPGSKFTKSGTVTRTNSAGVTQTVNRYTASVKLGKIEPNATYGYEAQEDLWLPTVTYKATVYSGGSTPQPPSKGAYNLTVNYVDEGTGSTITTDYKSYSSSDVTSSAGISGAYYGYYQANTPSGYTLDSSKNPYSTSDGYRVTFDVPAGGIYDGLNGYSSTNNCTLTLYCTGSGPITPPPPPVQETGTVIERYFLDGVEQTADEKEIDNVDVGQQTYYVDKSYPRYSCTDPVATVDVTANNTVYADFHFKFQNNPPVVSLNLPETITLGDDLNVNAAASDPDGDSITYSWNTPEGMTGNIKDSGGTVQFINKGDIGQKKTFTVTVTDPYGASATATATTTVVAPKPTVSINQSGTLKENRKVTLSETSDGGSKSFPIDNTKTQWSFYDSNNNPITVTNTADSGIVESLDNSIGTSSMNVLFTKAGTYTAKCQVTNTNGDIGEKTITFNIAEDQAPIADFDLPTSTVYRDPTNGNIATISATDKSYSPDGDNISKRIWFYSFDSNNDGSFDDEVFYVYQNGAWQKYGSYDDVKALANNSSALDSINSGNLTNIQLKPQNFNGGTHVGKYRIEEIVQESFGQDTIQSLITSKDFRVGTTY